MVKDSMLFPSISSNSTKMNPIIYSLSLKLVSLNPTYITILLNFFLRLLSLIPQVSKRINNYPKYNIKHYNNNDDKECEIKEISTPVLVSIRI